MAALATPFQRILDGFRPNRHVALPASLLYAVASAATFGVARQLSASSIPRPGEVWAALGTLWYERGLYAALSASFVLNLHAIAWSTAIALGLAYLTVLPAARPIVAAASK